MKSDPKFVEQLVEIITREVLVAMAEQEAQAVNPDGYQCEFDCADQLCVRLCYDRMGIEVNAGAERLSSTLGVIPPEQGLAKMIDHTLLKPDATQQEIAQLCFALNNGTTHGIEEKDSGIQVQLTAEIHKALEKYKISGGQHGTSGTTSARPGGSTPTSRSAAGSTRCATAC